MKTPKMIVEHLIDLGNVAGGVDNITVVAVQFSK
jgi:serine/threonine protein phosphatase PrpC